MTLVRDVIGFEAGDNAGLFAFSGNVAVVGDGNARTGDFYFKVQKPTASSGSYAEIRVAGITSTSGGGVKAILRAYVRLRAYPSVNNEPVLGFMSVSTIDFAMEVDTTGHVRARTTGGVVSAYSTAALALNTWYEVILTAEYTDNPSGQDASTTTVQVTGVETVSATNASAGFGPYTLKDAHVGGWISTTAAIETDYDDVVVLAGSDADRTSVVLPSATRITPVRITGQGASADFVGDWRNCRDVPYESSVVTDQTSAVDEQSTTFTHRTGASLGASGIAALKVYAVAKASVAASHAILINGVEYAVSLPITYPAGFTVPMAIDWGLTDGAFDAAEIGFRNKTGATVSLANVTAEVLHAGTPVVHPAIAGVESWKHRTGVYTGNGTFQSITHNLGAAPQGLLIKKASGVSSSGALWLARLGGTATKVIGVSALNKVAVTAVDATVFELGVSTHVNENGVQYQWLAIQDGGGHSEGAFFDCGVYLGNGLDTRNLVTTRAFQPEVVLTFGSTQAVYRDTSFVGDASMVLASSAVTVNLIQALNANGFQVGSDAQVNQNLVAVPYVCIRLGSSGKLSGFFAFGNFTPVSGSYTVTGVAFAPVFVFADRPNIGDCCWRGTGIALHTGLIGGLWSSTATATTGITAMTADGFSVGATVAVNGETARWMAFLDQGSVPVTQVEVEPGLGESFGPLVWTEYATPPANAVKVMAGVDLPDPASYYGGYKEPRLLTPGTVVRALSDEQGQYQGSRFGVTLDDKDRYFRDLLDRYHTLANRRLVLRMIADEDRRLHARPRTVAVGIVRDYRAEKGLTFFLEAEDAFALLTGLGSNDVLLPRRLVSEADFPDAPPADAIGKPVPILYGRISDEAPGTVPSPLYPRDNVDPGWTENSVRCSAGSIPNDQWLVFYVTRIYQGRESNGGIFFSRWGGDCHPTDPFGARIVWNKLTEVDLYRIYFADTAGWHPFDNPLGTNLGRYLDLTPAMITDPSPLGAGLVEYTIAALTEGADHKALVVQVGGEAPKVPNGLVPVLPVGTEQLGGATGEIWTRLLVAGHAVKEIEAVFVGGKKAAAGLYGAGVGQELLVPGFTDWSTFFSTNYREINGRRYTILYARGATAIQALDRSASITVNVKGIEQAGDSSGVLIADLFDQYEHLLRNWVLRDYQTGAWATSGPMWGDTPYDVDRVDASSFAACRVIANGRVTGGYVGAFAVGLDSSDAGVSVVESVSTAYKQESVRTWLARLNQSADCYSGFSRHSQFVVRMIHASQAGLTTAPHYTAELGINAGTFGIEEHLTTIENQIEVRFGRQWARTSWAGALRYEDLDAQTLLDEVRPYQLTLWAVVTTSHAADIGARRLERRKFPARLVTWESDMGGLTADLGDLLRLTHPEGVGALGWTDRPVWVLRHEFQPARFVVRFTALDVQWTFTPNIAHVGFLPPLVDGLSDQGAADAFASVVAAAALDTRPVGCDFDLAILDAVCLNAGEDPVAPDVREDDPMPTSDLHTTGP